MTAPYVSDKNAFVIAVLLALSIPVGSQAAATKTADQLSRGLSDGSAKVRGRAVADLSRLGYEAIQAVPALFIHMPRTPGAGLHPAPAGARWLHPD